MSPRSFGSYGVNTGPGAGVAGLGKVSETTDPERGEGTSATSRVQTRTWGVPLGSLRVAVPGTRRLLLWAGTPYFTERWSRPQCHSDFVGRPETFYRRTPVSEKCRCPGGPSSCPKTHTRQGPWESSVRSSTLGPPTPLPVCEGYRAR